MRRTAPTAQLRAIRFAMAIGRTPVGGTLYSSFMRAILFGRFQQRNDLHLRLGMRANGSTERPGPVY
ncbi:hypothetical protein C100_22520 [Sphingobium sp. C100]|jgi:hypothetical protein|uniref:hypothetical protein n=1 Tax=Sphingobium sp. C100 TaxID=1207055 RepID=UPI0003D5ABD6|nr:hypothetical protein [Sphingobium sp. C100]ETI58920.1 hypothetical protein C100_22520 [Sphingobium sp. C100]